MGGIIGMGNALVDILVTLDNEDFLNDLGIAKGSMQLVDLSFSNRVLGKVIELPQTVVSGGSASNTIHGLSKMGVTSAFIGKISDDQYGSIFRQDLEKNGITPKLFSEPPCTGRAVALITPDSERTFATYLGSAVNLCADEITGELFKGYDLFHIEGYLVQNHELLEKALFTAKQEGLTVSLDLASFNIVEENLEFLQKVTGKFVDILFANEEEASVFTGLKAEEAVVAMGQKCPVSIVKTGAEGSLVFSGGNTVKVSSIKALPVDTTGAGDLYASGFLFGMINDLSFEKCGMIGSLLAGRVIEQVGAKIPEQKWDDILKAVRGI